MAVRSTEGNKHLRSAQAGTDPGPGDGRQMGRPTVRAGTDPGPGNGRTNGEDPMLKENFPRMGERPVGSVPNNEPDGRK